MDGATTLGDQARAALAAYERLASLAEEIEDEWTYVTDLSAAWQGRIEELIDERGSEPVDPLEEAAIGRAIDEIGRISDPHRAIDWLSTFPQVILVSLGEWA
jgi:hypothetical protein